MIEFEAWPKTPRLFRDITVTEKIDGTNVAVIIQPIEGPGQGAYRHVIYTQDRGNFAIAAQSRKRIITPGKGTDNYGFAQWVEDNAETLLDALGPGRHFGEWWGQGIQRGYGIDHKRFSVFNTHRYDGIEEYTLGLVSTVPVLYQGPYSEDAIRATLEDLEANGSVAAPTCLNPEGVVVYHSASGQVYKVLLENDHLPKGVLA